MPKNEEKSPGTTKDLEIRARRVKMEMDTLEIAHHGMTFEELIRLLAPGAANQRALKEREEEE